MLIGMSNIRVEDVEALLAAVEEFFGTEVFMPTQTSEPKYAALNKAGSRLKADITVIRLQEKAKLGKEIFSATYEGAVYDVHGDVVIANYSVDDEVITQEYHASQFIGGVTPPVDARLRAFVSISLIEQNDENQSEDEERNSGREDESEDRII